MKTKTKAFLIALVAAVALLGAACPQQTSIGNIERNPSRYVGKDVAVGGRVTNSFGVALLGGVYKVDDGSGSLWVLTTRSVPTKGAQVGVKGQLQDGVNFGGRNYGLGLIEDQRRIR